ncbi:MAG: histidinol-phosphate aminotransferase family protein [Chloroflexi bacterium]|nr:histidinol-phosphate aminotransferase family protein [Chloroflexota bacterium]
MRAATAIHTVHGGLDLTELRALGLDPQSVLDFSASINPLGTPAGVRAAIASADVAPYPDRRCLALREALARRLCVGMDCILPGNGSTELIHLLASAFLIPGNTAFLFTPTFGEYEAACRLAGATIHEHRASEGESFRWDLASACEELQERRPRLAFLCNPNNPTGVYLSYAEVEAIASAIPGGGLLVLDEAYVPLTAGAWDAVPLLALGNVVLLRSMTKDYALAGVRLGYMVAPPDVAARVQERQVAWSVSSLAQAAGVTALQEEAHVEQGRCVIAGAKAYLMAALASIGVSVAPSPANFLLVKVGKAGGVRLALLRRGVCVRDCASFGLPEHIRIGVRPLEDCRRLVAALEEVLRYG